jgi:hypothetical protein
VVNGVSQVLPTEGVHSEVVGAWDAMGPRRSDPTLGYGSESEDESVPESGHESGCESVQEEEYAHDFESDDASSTSSEYATCAGDGHNLGQEGASTM